MVWGGGVMSYGLDLRYFNSFVEVVVALGDVFFLLG